MAVDNYTDLSTATGGYSTVGANAARISAWPGVDTPWYLFIANVDRDEYCIHYKDYGAAYFNLRTQPIYFTFTCARRPYDQGGMVGVNWVCNNDPSGGTMDTYYLVTNAAGDGVGLRFAEDSVTTFDLYLEASRGGNHYSSGATQMTVRDSNLPLYCKMYQTDTTYYVEVYDQPKYTAAHLLYTLSLAVASSGSDTFRYHIPLASYRSDAGHNDYYASASYGNCYLGGNTPPDLFYVTKTHYLIHADDAESFADVNWPSVASDLSWTKVEPDGAGCTVEYQSTDGYDTAHIAYVAGSRRVQVYAATSVTTLSAGEIKILFQLNSMSDGDHCPIFGLYEATPQYLSAEVVRSGANYYWRLAKHQGGARTEGSQTRYQCTPGTWYELVITIEPNENGTPAGILYIKEVGGAAVAVESQAKTKFAPGAIYLGYQGGLAAADVSGDFNVALLEFQNGTSGIPSIDKHENVMFSGHKVMDEHGATSFNTKHIDIFRTTDGGVTPWPCVYTFGPAAGEALDYTFIRYNAIRASWWIFIHYYKGSDNTQLCTRVYEVTDATSNPITVALRATWDTAPTKFRAYPSRIIDGDGKFLMGLVFQDTDDVAGTNHLDMAWFETDPLGDYSLDDQVTVAVYGDCIANYKIDEPSFYYTDDSHLHCIMRTEGYPIEALCQRLLAHEESGDDGGTWPDDPVRIDETMQGWAGKPQFFSSGDYLYGQFYNIRTESTAAVKAGFCCLDRESLHLIRTIGLWAQGSIAIGNGDCAVDSSGDEYYAYMATDWGSGGFVFEILVDELPEGGGGSSAAQMMSLGLI